MSSDAAQADTARAVASAELKDGVCLGIYEKALRSGPLAVSGSRVDAEAWRVFLDQVPRAGFSFLDLSIDESPEREARLDWDAGQCRISVMLAAALVCAVVALVLGPAWLLATAALAVGGITATRLAADWLGVY